MKTVRLMLAASAWSAVALATPALAQEATAHNAGTEQGAEQTSTAEGATGDVVVTAQKRAQTLLEVPQSVSVLSGELLERQQAKSFLDYAKLIPGLNVTQTFPGQSRLVLRGINTGSVGSTVGVYVDDIPYGQSGSLANGAILAGDFDTFDVARIEVLRGPQGTLYGANSLGGVLKYVTTAPKLGTYEGRGQAGVETTANGGTGYLANLVLNAPLGDMIAVRASGFYHRTAGYIDASGITATDIDKAKTYGGRVSVLFEPSSNFSVRLLGLAQNIRVDAPSAFEVNSLTLKAVNPITGAYISGDQPLEYERYNEFHNVDYRLYSGTIDWNLGALGDLTSVTSYSTQRERQVGDISTNAARGTVAAVYSVAAGVPAANIGAAFRNDVSVYKLTQEVRLASAKSEVFDYLIGAYYTHETTKLDQEYLPFQFSNGALIPTAGTYGPYTFQTLVLANISAHYEEIAGFANGTLHFGPRFDVTGGVRYSHNSQDSSQIVSQFGTGTPIFGTSSEGVFTWSASPRFGLSDRASIYARVAKGYRPGGPTFIPVGAAPDYPTKFNSDTLVSYEAGIKAETRDRMFGIDLSGFYVNWDNILIVAQVPTSAGPATVNTNGRRARTYGGEATATMRPTPGFSVVATLAYTRAYLRDDTTPITGGSNVTGGLAGDPLPYVPKWSSTVSADYEWALSRETKAFVGADGHLQSDQAGGFSAGYRALYGRPISLDGYATLDLRAGVEFGKLTVSAYARNVTNSHGLVSATYSAPPFSVPASIGGNGLPLATASMIRPRTIGGTVGFKF